MGSPDLIEQRQYAEAVLGGLNIRPFRVDVLQGAFRSEGLGDAGNCE